MRPELAALKGTMKGLTAALRGYSGAKLAVRQARDERARHEAILALENRKVELNALKDAAQLQIDRERLAQEERIEIGRRETERQGLQTSKDIAGLQVQGNKDIAEINADVQRYTVWTNAEGQKIAIDKQTGLAWKIAELEADTQENVTKMQTESQENITETQTKSQERIATMQTDAMQAEAKAEHARAMEIAKAQERIAEGKNNTDREIAQLDIITKQLLGPNAPSLGRVPLEKAKDMLDFLNYVNKNDDVKELRAVRRGYITGMQGYINAMQGKPVGDIEMINGLQRIVDPGVSVRSEDVHVMRTSAGNYSARVDVFFQQFRTGGVLSDEVRTQLAEAIISEYNAKVRVLWELPNSAGDQLRQIRETRGLSQYAPIPQFEQQKSSLEEILKNGVEAGWGAQPEPTKSEPAKITPDGQEGSGRTNETDPKLIGGKITPEQAVTLANEIQAAADREKTTIDKQLDDFRKQFKSKGHSDLVTNQIIAHLRELLSGNIETPDEEQASTGPGRDTNKVFVR